MSMEYGVWTNTRANLLCFSPKSVPGSVTLQPHTTVVIETSDRASPIHVPAPEERVSVHNLVLLLLCRPIPLITAQCKTHSMSKLLGVTKLFGVGSSLRLMKSFEIFHFRSCEPCFAHYQTKIFPINWKALLFGRVQRSKRMHGPHQWVIGA